MTETETELRCPACGAPHVVFESRPDYGGVAPASDPTTFSCQKCEETLFERNVKDGCSVLVLRAEDPLAEKLRADRRRLGRRLEPLRAWWADRDVAELALGVMGVVLLTLAALLLSMQ
jgi:hypothetical protein